MASFSEVQRAIRAHRGGIAAANRIVEKIANTGSLPDVDPKHYGAILRALSDDEMEKFAEKERQFRRESGEDDEGTPPRVATVEDIQPDIVYAHWNGAGIKRPSHD